MVLISIGTALSFGEMYLRWQHTSRAASLLKGRTANDLLTRPTGDDRIYELRPATILANAHGFSGPERDIIKGPGTYRIAAIGDSVTMQDGTEDGYVPILEKLLNVHRPDAHVEVLNFGVTGYGPRQERELLKARVLEYSPDLILWQFHDNDGADPTAGNADGGLVTYYVYPRSELLSWALQRVDGWLRARFVKREHLEGVRGELVDQLYRWDEIGEIFQQVASLAANRSVPVFLFLYPSWPRGRGWESYSARGLEIHARLSGRFRSLGFKVLDLLPLLEVEDFSSLRFAPDDPWHPNARGNRWIAHHLAAWLLRDGPPPLGGSEAPMKPTN